MSNQSHTIHPYQRRSAVIIGVSMVFYRLKSGFRQQGTQNSQRTFFHFPFNHLHHGFSQTFRHFEYNVSYKTVTHNHIYFTDVYITSFQCTGEIYTDTAHMRNGVFNQLISLFLLFTDRKHAYFGALHIKYFLHIGRAHHGKL